MKKNQQTILIIVGIILLLYFLLKNGKRKIGNGNGNGNGQQHCTNTCCNANGHAITPADYPTCKCPVDTGYLWSENNKQCEQVRTNNIIYGCTSPHAQNYNPSATQDDGSCIPIVYGCTDPTAVNYYAGAMQDDGTCIYGTFGCTDPMATNYNASATIDDNSCLYGQQAHTCYSVCGGSTGTHYSSLLTTLPCGTGGASNYPNTSAPDCSTPVA